MGSSRLPTVGLYILIALVAAALTAGLLIGLRPAAPGGSPPLSVAGVAQPTRNTIAVVGQGSAPGVPDQAGLSLGVRPTRGNVHDALNVAADEMNKLLAALHAQGVEDKDIQTSSLGVNQVSSCCPQSVTGYQAYSEVHVTVHHLTNVGALVAAGVDAVGNDIQIGGVTLSISDPAAQVKAARAASMTDAAARAKEWVGLANHHLGKIVGISETVSVPGFPIQCSGGCGGGGVAIQAGQTSVSVNVTVVYELQD